MKLSEHFDLKELTASGTARRLGFTEQFEPGPEEVENLQRVAENILEPIRAKFGAFTPTSAYRCARLNEAVKGAPNSHHVMGFAVDIDLGIRNKELHDWVMNNLEYTQLINEYPDAEGNPDWVHVSYNPQNLKKKNLTIK